MTRFQRPAIAIALVCAHALLVAFDVLPRYDALLLVPVAFVFAWLCRATPAWSRALLTTTFFFVFGAAIYTNQLTTGVEGRHALVGGIIPWSDAEGFLSNAWRAVHGLRFSAEVTRTATRPLYPMTFAATLVLAGHDVKLAIGAYAVTASVLMGLSARRIGDRYGWRALGGALVVFGFCLRRYFFVLGTESLGVIAGLVAFGLFAVALGRRDSELKASAVLPAAFLVLGVGLMARPGPFLAIPLLLVWIVRRATRAHRWPLTAACAGAFALGVGFNTFVVRTASEPGSETGGEFAPILYGALHAEDYTYLAIQHPEVSKLPRAERVGATARLIGTEVLERPWLAFGFFAGAASFLGGPHGHFSLGFYNPDDAFFEGKSPIGDKLRRAGPYRLLNLGAMAAFATAFVVLSWRAVWRRHRYGRTPDAPRDLLAEAALLVFTGAVLSACMTPPWITEAAQLQATTLPFFAILPWVYPNTPAPQWIATPPERRVVHWAAPVTFGAWLVLSLIFVSTRPRSIPSHACSIDGARAVWLEPSLLVRVASPNERAYTPNQMRRNLALLSKHNKKLTGPLGEAVIPGRGIEMVFDGCAERAAIVLDSADELGKRGRGWMWIRATPVDTDQRMFDDVRYSTTPDHAER